VDGLTAALITAALLLGMGPALWYDMQARERLSSDGEKHPWRVYWLGVFAGRREFTHEGWRYHVRAILLGVFGILLAIIIGVLGTR